MTEPDTDAEFRADRIRHSAMLVDHSVYEHLKLLKAQPEACEQCMAKVREVLKTYEHP